MRVRKVVSEGVAVKNYLALEIPDNLQVAAQEPAQALQLPTYIPGCGTLLSGRY